MSRPIDLKNLANSSLPTGVRAQNSIISLQLLPGFNLQWCLGGAGTSPAMDLGRMYAGATLPKLASQIVGA